MPQIELTCNGCSHRWRSRAKAGSSIRCPQCRQVRRMPAARPGTAAEARTITATGDDSEADRLAELWAAERPAAPWRGDLEGDAGHECGECGGPMHWAGAHTVLVCPARHVSGNARKVASPGAIDRETRHAKAQAAPRRESGPSPAEAEQVGEDRAVALDDIAHVRDQLGRIPRDDRWREHAVRGLHKLDRIEQHYKSARTIADMDNAHDAADELLDELDGVLRHAERLDRRQNRRERLLRLTRRGDEYEYDDDDQADDGDDDQAEPERAAPSRPAGGTVLCEPCHQLGRQVPATKRIDPLGLGGQQGRDVCDDHLGAHRAGDPGVQIVADYSPAISAFWAAYDRTAADKARAAALATATRQALNGARR